MVRYVDISWSVFPSTHAEIPILFPGVLVDLEVSQLLVSCPHQHLAHHCCTPQTGLLEVDLISAGVTLNHNYQWEGVDACEQSWIKLCKGDHQK